MYMYVHCIYMHMCVNICIYMYVCVNMYIPAYVHAMETIKLYHIASCICVLMMCMRVCARVCSYVCIECVLLRYRMCSLKAHLCMCACVFVRVCVQAWAEKQSSWLKTYAAFKVQLDKERTYNNKWW